MRQMLEEYLDNQLSPKAHANVERDLANDPSLARLLLTIKQERALRLAAMNSYQPDEKTASQLTARVLDEIRHPTIYPFPMTTWLRRSAAAAAILILAGVCFYAGRTTAPRTVTTEFRYAYSVMYFDDAGDVRHREFKTLSEANDFMAQPEIKRGMPEVKFAENDFSRPGSF